MSSLLFLCTSLVLCLVYANESKRLVLHSDTDIATQIMSMKNQVDTQMLEIRDLKSKLSDKDAKIDSLANETIQMRANISALVTENSEIKSKLVTLESAGGMYWLTNHYHVFYSGMLMNIIVVKIKVIRFYLFFKFFFNRFAISKLIYTIAFRNGVHNQQHRIEKL